VLAEKVLLATATIFRGVKSVDSNVGEVPNITLTHADDARTPSRLVEILSSAFSMCA